MPDEWILEEIEGVEYYTMITSRFRIPVDWTVGSQMFIALANPVGGLGSFPAITQGDPGDTPTIDTTINLTVLENDDPGSDAASWTEISPDTYRLNLTIHGGPQGDPGDTPLDPGDYGTAVAGKILVVNLATTGFELATQKVGDRYIPASINSTPAGNATYTLASVSVPAQGFDWRPEVSGQCIVTGTGANVSVDLVARLDNATSGNVVGRGFGIPGVGPATLGLSSGPPPGSSVTYDKVSAGAAATVYLRAERTSGTDTFTTSSATTWFKVKVGPVP